MTTTDADWPAAWKKLRTQIKREQRRWDGKGTNRESRTVAAGMTAAYAGVLRMMDRLEEQ